MSTEKVNTFLSEWDQYREMCVHPEAHQIQIEETEKAFYAGAYAFVSLLYSGLSEGSDAQDVDIALLESLVKEIEAKLESRMIREAI